MLGLKNVNFMDIKNITAGKSGKKMISLRGLMLFAFIPIVAFCIIISSVTSYVIYSRQIRSIASLNALNTVSQATRYFESRLYDVFTDFVALEKYRQIFDVRFRDDGDGASPIDPNIYISIYNDMEKMHSTYYSVIESIFVGFEFPDGSRRYVYYCEDTLKGIDFSFDKSIGRYKLSEEGSSKYTWTGLHTDAILQKAGPERQVTTLFSVAMNHQTNIKTLVYVNFKNSFFEDILYDNILENKMYMTLVGNDGIITFKDIDQKERINEKTLYSKRLANKKDILQLSNNAGDNIFFVYDTIHLNNWRFAMVINQRELFSLSDYIQFTTFITVALLLLLSLAIIYISANLITRPIKNWIIKIRNLQQDDLNITFDDNICYEISQFNNGLNYLMRTVKRLLQNIEEEHEKKRALEIMILQQQINPHFLYNTLHSIQQLYGMGESADGNKMLSNLSSFFRLSLSKGKEIVSISTELEHIRVYLEIQQMRHDRMKYTIDVPEELLGYKILKLSLQPLVENAIYHGIYGLNKGIISITGRAEDDDIFFEVCDNGKGIEKERLEKLRKCLETNEWEDMPEVYGIKNVHERLRILFGKGYGISIAGKPGEGSIITVRIRKMKE